MLISIVAVQIFPEIGIGNRVERMQQVARIQEGFAEMEKLVFYGKTKAEIEDRFLKWQQANARSVRNIKAPGRAPSGHD